jgi:hypothetical protein
MKTMTTKLSAATFVSLFAVGAAQADPVDSIYAQNTDGTVWRLDIGVASVTEIEVRSDLTAVGAAGVNSPNALANVNGRLYRASFDVPSGNQTIFNEDVPVGEPTTSLQGAGSIAAGGAFGSDYYFADGYGKIFKFDTTTGDATTSTQVGDLGNVTTEYGDLVVKDATTLVLSVGDAGNVNKWLFTYDLTTNTKTQLTGVTQKFAGIAFGQSGTLYGIRSGANDTGVYSIDLSGVGSVAPIANYTSGNIYTDAAPVPIPAAAWLFGSALIGAIGLGRRKRNNALNA